LAAATLPSPFTFLSPESPPPSGLLILSFLFFSSNPLPNVLISDLGGLVDAMKEATNMNLDILGSAFVPVTGYRREVLRVSWILVGLIETNLAFERRRWSDSRAFVSEELKIRFNLFAYVLKGV
jgi:hypothetical protein